MTSVRDSRFLIATGEGAVCAAQTFVTIRDALEAEAPILEALQRRSSGVWEEYRVQLAANPDAIVVPRTFIDNGWARVAVDGDLPIGFSVVIPGADGVHELDGL